ncbi:glucose-1-phosphate thymidylyltransferase [Candidatus Daviesbacteria bacterium]|nr:glucose-1-phosphate thymidylyltransferase [Candidatus Daviesbacteria bacterium]
MKAIIPTGGRGTRMRPLTFSTNKHFIPVANKPLIFYPIETIADTGIKEVGITYNPGGLEEAKAYLGDGSKWGLSISYILQEKAAGLANIVQVCEQFLNGDSFVFHLGDNMFVDGIKDQVKYFEKKKPDGLVTMIHHKENRRMGVPFFDDNGRLIKYVEKPENPPHDFAVPGVYFGNSNFFKCFKGEKAIKPSERGEYEIPAAFQWLIDNGYRVNVLEYKGKWLDPGKFDDWILANHYILENKLIGNIECPLDQSSKIEGKVVLGKDCTIVNTRIHGPVIIGDNVVITDSEVGPFVSIAHDCEIVGSIVSNSVLMSGVRVIDVKEHPVDNSLVGTDSEVIGKNGRGATTSLFVGEKCKIQI